MNIKRRKLWVAPLMLAFGSTGSDADNETSISNSARQGQQCGESIIRYGPQCGIRTGQECKIRQGNQCHPARYGPSCKPRTATTCTVRQGAECKVRTGQECKPTASPFK